MNMFLRPYTQEEVDKLVGDNPLAKVRPSDLRLRKFSNEDGETDKDKEVITNETSERYSKFMENELQNLEDQGELDREGQTAIQRHKKMQEEQKKHKENLKNLKKSLKSRKGRFDRKNLNSDFFTNAKSSKANENKGWAMDFGVDESCVVSNKPSNFGTLPGESDKLRQEKMKQKEEKAKKEQEEASKNEKPQDTKLDHNVEKGKSFYLYV
jgi:hypothetical protein